ncbi:MAG TPA: hypothetical protein VFP12_11870 [Allosphingosinicella sp.]|nr:hypothetical protein [Allosphingosinicella sp.]
MIAWLNERSGALGVIAAFVALIGTALGTYVNSVDSRTQMQASILNDFKNDFDKLADARCVAASFALAHMDTLRHGTIPYKNVPSSVWGVMDFFDKLSMYSSRDYVDKQMAFVGFYYWMGPYWEFYKEEVDGFKGANPLAMYDEIDDQVDALKNVAIKDLGKTDANFKTALSDPKIKEFFELERAETCGQGQTESTRAETRAQAPTPSPGEKS